MSDPVEPKPQFLMTVCQVGAENALKQEISQGYPGFHLAYSRPGFVTFKLPEDFTTAQRFTLKSVFSRTSAFCLQKVATDDIRQLAVQIGKILSPGTTFHHLHFWQRDRFAVGQKGFEPRPTESMQALTEQLGQTLAEVAPGHSLPINQIASRSQTILDCVLVDPGLYWLAAHRANQQASRWPGGVFPIEQSQDVISRAYYKMIEALAWSRFPIHPGDSCVELGCAPGGASLALLKQGYHVIGIDPAQMDPQIARHPNFTHIRKRAADLKRREYRTAQWLVSDINVAPQAILKTVESIATHKDVRLKGLILTIKLKDWSMAAETSQFLERVRSWGFREVRARQLAYNRREICISALRNRGLRRMREIDEESEKV